MTEKLLAHRQSVLQKIRKAEELQRKAEELPRMREELATAGESIETQTVSLSPSQIGDTLAERGARYGDFADHAALTDGMMCVISQAPGWSGRLRPVHRQAIRVILDKIARVVNGDPEYLDNWHDIQGYAKLAEERSFGEGKDQ